MTTLTEFLLARIAWLEADVRARGTVAVGHPSACIYEGGYEGTQSCDCGAVDRVLADCEAKRRIVERCAEMLAVECWEYDDAPRLAEEILCDLATIYAAHPDYDEIWRP